MSLNLSLDVETTGLVNKATGQEEPRIVQIGAVLFDDDGTVVGHVSCYVRSDGWEIPRSAEKVHGITVQQANRCGVDIRAALGMVAGFARNARRLVGHNIEFDRGRVAYEIRRLGHDPSRSIDRARLENACTMRDSVPVVMARHPDGGVKWPSLDEALQRLLGRQRSETHTAIEDAVNAMEIHLKLAEMGVRECPADESSAPSNVSASSRRPAVAATSAA